MRLNYLRVTSKEEVEKEKKELIDFIENDDWSILHNFLIVIKRERERHTWDKRLEKKKPMDK